MCPISHLNQNSSPCTGSILAHRKGKSSSRCFQQGRSRAPYSGTDKVFSWYNSFPKATINSTVYCEMLKTLRHAIQNKRRGMLSATVLLLHNNAQQHSAAQTQNLITSFKWEQMDHSPYSPDLAPSDYHLFLHLKNFLGGKRFDDEDDLKDAVQKRLTLQAAAFYEDSIQKLVPRYDKCLNNGGEYVEK